MRMNVASVAVVSLAVLAGCATTTTSTRVAESPAASPPTETAARCLPPGLSPVFFGWPVHAFRPLMIRRDDDSVVRAAWVLYRKGQSEVAALWGGEELVAVDPSPRTDAPVWFDSGLVDGDGRTLLTEPSGRCRWRQEGGQIARL